VKRGARLHVPDSEPFREGLIGATALVHAMTAVTRNVENFQPMGVKTLNPWDQRETPPD
jgi:predicted nucleic acid-binding protein